MCVDPMRFFFAGLRAVALARHVGGEWQSGCGAHGVKDENKCEEHRDRKVLTQSKADARDFKASSHGKSAPCSECSRLVVLLMVPCITDNKGPSAGSAVSSSSAAASVTHTAASISHPSGTNGSAAAAASSSQTRKLSSLASSSTSFCSESLD
jgi:hypothetical protein